MVVSDQHQPLREFFSTGGTLRLPGVADISEAVQGNGPPELEEDSAGKTRISKGFGKSLADIGGYMW